MKFTKILCAIDFSPASTHALRMATNLAKASECELVIAHSWHLPALYYSELAFPSNAVDAMVEGTEAELAKASREATSAGVARVSTLLLEGVPAKTIVDALEADPAFDLVVLGANGRSGLGRVLMGSVAEKLVRLAPCSVLAIHATHALGAFRNILCPVDFSETSLDAVELALRLLEPGGDGLTLLHVLDLPLNYSVYPEASAFVSELDMKSTSHLDAIITAPTTKAAAAKATIKKSTRIGNPGRQILAMLESEPRYDLVVMGTHGRTGLRRVVLGSVAEKVVRNASCPVIVVRKRMPSA